jgi:hypothetical protein
VRVHSSSTVTERSAETISLTLPADPRYATVARIVVGGLAARLNLSYEALDDLQLAVETLLGEEQILGGDQVTMDLDVEEGTLGIVIGPIDTEVARSALDSGGPLSLRVVLAAVVDETVVDETTQTLRLRKAVPMLQRD